MKKATALIYTILLAGIIIFVSLAIGRLALSEIKMASSASESIVAYYFAEAGLEEALLRWRWDRNEIQPPGASANTPDVLGVNIDLGTRTPFPDLNRCVQEGRNYCLKIWYKDNSAPGSTDNDSDGFKRINKDEVWELDVAGLSAVDLEIKFYGVNQIPPPGETVAFGLELTKINNTGQQTDFFDQGEFPPSSPPGYFGRSINYNVSSNLRLRIRPWIRQSNGYLLVKITPSSGTGNIIDTGTTVVESTGVFRNTKRKLQAQVDRLSGAILGIYDFILYGGEEIKQ